MPTSSAARASCAWRARMTSECAGSVCGGVIFAAATCPASLPSAAPSPLLRSPQTTRPCPRPSLQARVPGGAHAGGLLLQCGGGGAPLGPRRAPPQPPRLHRAPPGQGGAQRKLPRLPGQPRCRRLRRWGGLGGWQGSGRRAPSKQGRRRCLDGTAPVLCLAAWLWQGCPTQSSVSC